MKLIVGLGNPGEKYIKTRHNVGFMVLDVLCAKLGLEFKNEVKFKSLMAKGERGILVKPQTYMNGSGEAVAKLARFYKTKPEEIVVVHDDLDIRLGEFKMQKSTGPKVHNGIENVESQLGTKDFWRIRIGVDGREGDRSVKGEEYVLGRFMKEERDIVDEVIEKVVKIIAENF